MCKHLFDLRVLEIMVLFAIIFIRSKYPLNMEEIMDLWISNWRYSSYEKFTSIFLIFKYSRNWIRENRFVSSKFPRYLLKLRLDISSMFFIRPVAHPILSESYYDPFVSFHRSGSREFGHEPCLPLEWNRILTFTFLSRYKWDYLLIPDFVILFILFSKVWKNPYVTHVYSFSSYTI